MRIAILSFYSGWAQRGVENWTFEIATRLAKSHDVTVFQNFKSDNKCDYSVQSINLNYDKDAKYRKMDLIRRVFLHYQGRKIALFSLKIIPILLKNNFDVIIPTDGGWEPAFIRILTWITSKKMVIVGHAGLGWDDKNNLWCFPDCFVALSSYAEKWARKINPFVWIEYIPDGVNTKLFTEGGKKNPVDLSHPIVLSVGALNDEKRMDLVIRAVATLERGSLLIVGDGEKKNELKILGEKILENRFSIRSFKYEKMPEVYRSSDVFVSAARPLQSFEMVIVEALATNKPVVANNDPIRAEIIGNAGFLGNPNNTNEFSSLILSAINKDWGKKPEIQARQFSWNRVIKKYNNLFREVIK